MIYCGKPVEDRQQGQLDTPSIKKGLLATKRASGRSLTSVANGHAAAPPMRVAKSRRRMQVAMRPSRGGHATEGTISHLDVLRCGTSNRPRSARGRKHALPQRSSNGRFAPINRHKLACSTASPLAADGRVFSSLCDGGTCVLERVVDVMGRCQSHHRPDA